MRSRVLASVTTVALSGAMLFGTVAPASAAAPAAPAASTQARQLATVAGTITDLPLTQTVNGVTTTVGSFTGTFTPTSFKSVGGVLQVTGLLEGTAKGTNGAIDTLKPTQVTTTVAGAASSAAAALAAPSCDILNLVLGPLHLNVLGLVVDLNQVVLNITAQSGAGNLLGNLLCAVAGLLDNNGGLNGLATLLNRLLGL